MIIPRKILAKYGCMINIKDLKKIKINMLLCLWLFHFNHVYLDIWRFFFPIFCDLAKVMIIPAKILAKYGCMLNIEDFF